MSSLRSTLSFPDFINVADPEFISRQPAAAFYMKLNNTPNFHKRRKLIILCCLQNIVEL